MASLIYFVYDGSFEGLLTGIFEVYNRKAVLARLIPAERYQPDAFSEKVEVYADESKANRVWKGLQKKLSTAALLNVYACFLSELPEREEWLLAFVREVFASAANVEENYASPPVLRIAQIGKQLGREKHRFEAFVRFRKLSDGTFYAPIEPDFNVIPLITSHFVRRYADQPWIIYDLRRRYGIQYDPREELVQEVRFDFTEPTRQTATLAEAGEEREDLYQTLWQAYFRNAGIPARRNLKLHRQHVPIRYWKYLVEKQPPGRKGGPT